MRSASLRVVDAGIKENAQNRMKTATRANHTSLASSPSITSRKPAPLMISHPGYDIMPTPPLPLDHGRPLLLLYLVPLQRLPLILLHPNREEEGRD